MLVLWTGVQLALGFEMKRNIHVCAELTESLVEIVHLRQNASDNHNNKHICRRMRELVVACESHLQGKAKRLDEHDRDRARRRADGEVDERVLAAVLGRNLVDHKEGEDGDKGAVEEKAWLQRKVQNLVHRRNLLVRWRMEHDNHRADQTYRTTNLAQQAELFVEEVGAKNRADEDRQRAERGNEDRGRKRIRCKVEDFTEYHFKTVSCALVGWWKKCAHW